MYLSLNYKLLYILLYRENVENYFNLLIVIVSIFFLILSCLQALPHSVFVCFAQLPRQRCFYIVYSHSSWIYVNCTRKCLLNLTYYPIFLFSHKKPLLFHLMHVIRHQLNLQKIWY